MKLIATIGLCAAALAVAAPEPVSAAPGVIERACRQAKRPAATPKLCGCIQSVAESSLSRSERRTVARWFGDPHQAQVVRQSDKRSDEILWKRYKAFGEKARKACG